MLLDTSEQPQIKDGTRQSYEDLFRLDPKRFTLQQYVQYAKNGDRLDQMTLSTHDLASMLWKNTHLPTGAIKVTNSDFSLDRGNSEAVVINTQTSDGRPTLMRYNPDNHTIVVDLSADEMSAAKPNEQSESPWPLLDGKNQLN